MVYVTKSPGTYIPSVERRSRVSSASPFSLRSTTTSFDGLKGSNALIKEEPIEPAPPITSTLFPHISRESTSRLASISSINIERGRSVTHSAINLSKFSICALMLLYAVMSFQAKEPIPSACHSNTITNITNFIGLKKNN
ncbi:hypothetical protein IMSAGC016_01710 [Muribaculaceae bacterium]|nr:hypothetical protein IMSAGC016_01710 [Muribaculaceae bacterium]